MKRTIWIVPALMFALSSNVLAEETKPALEVKACSGEESKTINLSKDASRKITIGKGQELELKFPGGGLLTGSIEEKKRKPRYLQEAQAIAKAVLKTESLMASDIKQTNECHPMVEAYDYGTIDYDVTQTLDGVEKQYKGSIKIGKAEHFYFATDLPVSNIKQEVFDAATGKKSEREKPANFYVSLNAKVGDVYTDYDAENYLGALALKFMVKASSRPLDSAGVGLALPMPFLKSPLELFVAEIWTKDDPSVGGDAKGTTKTTAFGVSLNIDSGIAWFTGK